MPDSSETRPTSLRLVLLFFAITCYILSQIRYFVNGAATYIWSREPGLNRRPAAYKAAALPTELSRRVPMDVRSTLLILAKVASLSKIWYNTMSCWSSLVAMTRDCKSLGFGLRRFESYLQHHVELFDPSGSFFSPFRRRVVRLDLGDYFESSPYTRRIVVCLGVRRERDVGELALRFPKS